MQYLEAIDKISFAINPLVLAKGARRIKKIRSNSSFRISHGPFFTTIDIQAEYFNPFLDYHTQLSMAIILLMQEGIISFPIIELAPFIVPNNLRLFILFITEIEFYFDFMPSQLTIDEDAVTADPVNEDDKLLNRYQNTVYSRDITKKIKRSRIAMYDRKLRLKHVRHIPFKEIDNLTYHFRFEIRLTRASSDFLHLDNLSGTYADIISRYRNHLSGFVYWWVLPAITVNPNDQPEFAKIYDLASDKRQRSGKGLKKNETKMERKAIKASTRELLDTMVTKDKGLRNGKVA